MYLFSFQDFDALPLGGMSRYFRTAFLCLVLRLLALGSLTWLNVFPRKGGGRRRRCFSALCYFRFPGKAHGIFSAGIPSGILRSSVSPIKTWRSR